MDGFLLRLCDALMAVAVYIDRKLKERRKIWMIK